MGQRRIGFCGPLLGAFYVWLQLLGYSQLRATVCLPRATAGPAFCSVFESRGRQAWNSSCFYRSLAWPSFPSCLRSFFANLAVLNACVAVAMLNLAISLFLFPIIFRVSHAEEPASIVGNLDWKAPVPCHKLKQQRPNPKPLNPKALNYAFYYPRAAPNREGASLNLDVGIF